jgi:hypothetical protein
MHLRHFYLFSFYSYMAWFLHVQYCFVCHPLDYIVSEDAGIETKTFVKRVKFLS